MTSETTDNWNLHWERYAPSAEINPAQRYRRDLILREIADCDRERFLDIGSGQGDLCALVRHTYPSTQIRGLELSEVGVRVAGQKVPQGFFLQRDLTQNAEVPAEWKDWATVAVCSEVLEHIDHPAAFLRQVMPYLASGARIVVTVPAGPQSAFDKHIGHRQHFTSESIRKVASEAGLQVEKVQASGFPFMNLYKLVVILRGKRLIRDVAKDGGASATGLARVLMGVFQFLFRFNLSKTPWGWQMVAVLKKA